MRARTETIELGERVSRALTMENSGPRRCRIWWIVSSALLAAYKQDGGGTTGPDLTSASIDKATGQVRDVFDDRRGRRPITVARTTAAGFLPEGVLGACPRCGGRMAGARSWTSWWLPDDEFDS